MTILQVKQCQKERVGGACARGGVGVGAARPWRNGLGEMLSAQTMVGAAAVAQRESRLPGRHRRCGLADVMDMRCASDREKDSNARDPVDGAAGET